jgi:hypothetical protein
MKVDARKRDGRTAVEALDERIREHERRLTHGNDDANSGGSSSGARSATC